jgi:DNA-binding protein Fis
MAAILVIEDDHNLKGLIRKIFPGDKLRILQTRSGDRRNPVPIPDEQNKEDPVLALEQIVREVLKSEVDTGNADHIHQSVIGKVERTLIGIVLEDEHGNQVRAAKRLGINRNTLRKKMKELQIFTRVVTH